MAKISKKMKNWREKIDSQETHELDTALQLVKDFAKSKFDESVDIVFRLGVDPRKADQMIRSSCTLPKGTGKTVRVLVFAKGEKEQEARDAGADHVGGEDIVKKIQEGWLDFDRVVATPDMMAQVGKIGKILGPRGLMPNPKVGTVSFNVKEVVENIKKGQVEFRTDKSANVHIPVGRASFSVEDLKENVQSVIDTIQKLKPSSAKGTYIRNLALSSTMGPGVKIDANSAR